MRTVIGLALVLASAGCFPTGFDPLRMLGACRPEDAGAFGFNAADGGICGRCVCVDETCAWVRTFETIGGDAEVCSLR